MLMRGLIFCFFCMAFLVSCTGTQKSQNSVTKSKINFINSLSSESQTFGYEDPQVWHCFHKNSLCQGSVCIDKTFVEKGDFLKESDFKLKWVFKIDPHVYSYIDNISVFSREPVVYDTPRGCMACLGCYDGSVYALDFKEGTLIWEFTAGAPVMSTPLVWKEQKKTFIAFSTWERSIYILNAETGEVVFKYETMKFSFGVVDTYTGDPCMIKRKNQTTLVFPIFISKRESLRYIYEGVVILIDGKNKSFIKKIPIAKTRLCSVAALSGKTQKDDLIFGATQGGKVYCLDPWTQEMKYSFVMTRPVIGGPVLGIIENRWKLFIGDCFGLVHCVDAVTEKIDWKYKTGLSISSAPAFLNAEKPLLTVGVNDREFYVLNASDGKIQKRYKTKDFISSSSTFLSMKNAVISAFTSTDGRLYLMDVKKKKVFFRYKCGDLIWPYETTGMTIWSNPVIVARNNRAYVIHPGMDGRVYLFESRQFTKTLNKKKSGGNLYVE